MAKPGAQIPRLGKEQAIGANQGAGRVAGCIAFRIAVTVAGSLKATFVDSPGEIVTLHYPQPGVYIEAGEFREVWLDAAPPTTEPAGTFVLLNA